MSTPVNPPAFPRPRTDEKRKDINTPHERIIREADDGCEGMSLRDWFAGQALFACYYGASKQEINVSREEAATEAYRIADAMLAERERTK